MVEDVDSQTIHALQYAKTIGSSAVHALHLTQDAATTTDLGRRWAELGVDVPLEIVTHDGDLPEALAWYVEALPEEVDVNVVLPAPATIGFRDRLRRWRATGQLTRALLPYERARVTLVRDHHGPGHAFTPTPDGGRRLRLVQRASHRVVVLVDRSDRATFRAVRYAMSLGATDVCAVHAAVDHDNQERLIGRWMELGVPVPLDVIECWDRNVARSLEGYVVDLMGKDSEITVVMCRRDYENTLQRLLHDRTSRKIVSALDRYEHVDVAVVPYYFHAATPRVHEEADRAPATGGARR
jgi:hypothetical protein